MERHCPGYGPDLELFGLIEYITYACQEMRITDINSFVLIGLSFLIGLGCVAYVRSKDKHERESYLTLVLVTALGGVISIMVCLWLYDFAYQFIDSSASKVMQSFIVIGPVEELAKLFTLLVLYQFIHKEMDEPVDGMIYIACIALGFSLIENYFYATRTPGSSHLIFFRLFLSTPIHITDSILMGLGFYVWTQRRQSYGLLLAAFIYASFIHGLFDAAIYMQNDWTGVAFVAITLFSFYVGIAAVNFGTAISPFRPTLEEYLKSVIHPGSVHGLDCSHCGDTEKKQLFRHRHFTLQKCTNCENLLLDQTQLDTVISYFTSKTLDRQEFLGYFGDQADKTHHEPEKLNSVLENIRQHHIEIYTGSWLPKRFFRSNSDKN